MMRVLAERHRGRLPVDAVEGIWRIIISTFTHVQAPFAVHAEGSAGGAAMRDSVRFHFGFTVPYHEEPDAQAVIAAVAASRGDLGLVAPATARGAWWRGLRPSQAPKVIARLPFVERPGHPAATPALVLAASISGEGLGAVVLYAAEAARSRAGTALEALGGQVVAEADGSILIVASRSVEPERIAAALAADVAQVGSHPEPVRL